MGTTYIGQTKKIQSTMKADPETTAKILLAARSKQYICKDERRTYLTLI